MGALTQQIEAFEASLRAQLLSKEGRRLLKDLEEKEEVIAAAHAADLGHLIARVGESRSRSSAQQSAIISALLARVSEHPLCPLLVLYALLPGLLGVGRRLTWGRGGEWRDREEFLCDLFSCAFDVIGDFGGQSRPYALLDLLDATRSRMRRRLLAHRRFRTRHLLDHTCENSFDVNAMDEALRSFVHHATELHLSKSQKALLYGIDVLGYTLTELSAASGIDRRVLGAEHRRAGKEMVAHL
jgi:hypothetical protein